MRLAVLVILAGVLLMGCTQPAPAPTAVPTAVPTVEATATPAPTQAATPTPEAFKAIMLQYNIKGAMGPGTQVLTAWLTEEKACAGKKAMLGMMKIAEPGATDDRSPWAKATIYEEDGSTAYSGMTDKNKMAFDTATSQAQDFDFLLTLNSWFASAGRNFNTDEVWTKTTPTLLKNVQIGGSSNNLSITKTGESTQYALPCTEFTAVGEVGPGEMKFCVYKPDDKLPLPFVVKADIAGMIDIELTKESSEKPTVSFFAQCLESVKCAEVAQPPQEEFNACSARSASLEQVRDSNNCVTAYACKTLREQVLGDFARSQRPGCPNPENLVQKAVDCRSGQNPNVNYVQGNDGCISDVKCNSGQQPGGQ